MINDQFKTNTDSLRMALNTPKNYDKKNQDEMDYTVPLMIK